MKFCNWMGLQDPCMESQPPEARDYFLACYAVSLIQGHTIKGKYVKHSTLKAYMKEALGTFDDRGISPKSDQNFTKIVTTAHRKYESVPKRRRMVTDGMMAWLIKEADKSPPDSEIRAIVDWIVIGRNTGYRSSEWCQSSKGDYARIQNWPGRPSLAATRSDFTFLGSGERRLTHTHELTPARATHLTCLWRSQKNGDNGQEVTFAGDPRNPKYCIVEAVLGVYHRSRRLGTANHEPMAVYASMGKTHRITARRVTWLLREAAHHVLGLERSSPEITMWSTHSIRVTAANLLHRMRLSDSYIMKRLRWNSPAFLMYLRNTIHAADAHTKAINVKLSQADLELASYRSPEPHEQITQSAQAA